MPRVVLNPEDREWFGETTLADPAAILRYVPREAAAISQSSETFAVSVAEVCSPGARPPPRADQARGRPPAAIFVKRYRYRTLLGRWQGAFRGTLFGRSRARFEYEALVAIRSRGIAAVRPIGYVEFRKRGFIRACVLITEAEPDAQPLDRCFHPGAGAAGLLDRAARRRWSAGLSCFVARMHEAGVVHGALLGRNILVAGADTDEPRFVLLDPNPRGSITNGPAAQAGRLSDLSDLAATALSFTNRTDRARFLRTYLGRRRFSNADRGMIGEIERRAADLSATERHRQTIAAAILWLQGRIRSRVPSRPDGSHRRFESLAEFVAAINGAPVPESREGVDRRLAPTIGANTLERDGSARSIDIRLADGRAALLRILAADDGSSVCHCSVSNGSGGSARQQGADPHVAVADLRIACDEPTFLAAINGEVEALERARKGRIEVRGDAMLLDVLGSLADGRQTGAPVRQPGRWSGPLTSHDRNLRGYGS